MPLCWTGAGWYGETIQPGETSSGDSGHRPLPGTSGESAQATRASAEADMRALPGCPGAHCGRGGAAAHPPTHRGVSADRRRWGKAAEESGAQSHEDGKLGMNLVKENNCICVGWKTVSAVGLLELREM